MGIPLAARQPASVTSATGLTGIQLTPVQAEAIDALIDRTEDETLTDVADRVQVSRITLWRWLRKPEFVQELRARTEASLGAYRPLVAQALVKGAINPGPGQAAMQKIYWQRLGELVERSDMNMDVNMQVTDVAPSFEGLSAEGKRAILEVLVRERESRKQLQSKSTSELTEDEPVIDLMPVESTADADVSNQPRYTIADMPHGFDVDDVE